jgi:hypothetical protein
VARARPVVRHRLEGNSGRGEQDLREVLGFAKPPKVFRARSGFPDVTGRRFGSVASHQASPAHCYDMSVTNLPLMLDDKASIPTPNTCCHTAFLLSIKKQAVSIIL